MIQGVADRHPAGGFLRRFVKLTGGYWTDDRKWQARGLTAVLMALTVVQIGVPIAVNLWSQRFFDAIEQHSMDRFMAMVGMIGLIIVGNIAVQVLHLRAKRRLQFGWRAWLTAHLAETWLRDGRHHQVTFLEGEHDNPDGRIADDVRIGTEMAIDLAHSLSYCVILLVSFTQILWMVSGSIDLTISGVAFTVEGYLLYVAFAYAGAGTGIALLLGRPIVRATNARQGREADLRFDLARVRENSAAIALLHAEPTERGRFFGLFDLLRKAWHMQTSAQANLILFTAGWSVLSTAFPLLIAAPRYIAGAITLGVLMQTAQAFQQAVGALSWPIDNIGNVAVWRASVERVLGLTDALHRLEEDISERPESRVTVELSPNSKSLTFVDVRITEPNGQPVIEPFSAKINPGDRITVTGDPGATIKLFRAVVRAWPWGGGTILLPARRRVGMVPQRPYFPSGTLRHAVTYPAREAVSDDVLKAILERVGMGHLVARLDEVASWKEVLALAEQQRLGIARLLLRSPDWIFLMASFDALDPAGQQDVLEILDSEFSAATIVAFGSNTRSPRGPRNRHFVLERTGDVTTLLETAPIDQEDASPCQA